MKFLLTGNSARRAHFVLDMTAAERQLMRQHVAHWSDLPESSAIVFGPVADPQATASPW